MDSGLFDHFLSEVHSLIEQRVRSALSRVVVDFGLLQPGKMLRSRLAGRLSRCDSPKLDTSALQMMCAATELVHTASLCHDDVVDNALIRRSAPAMWQTTGPSGAILVGDLLLCEAIDMLVALEGGRHFPAFMAKVREVVETEAEQELLWRGKDADEDTCLRLARQKTGPLFAFVAAMSGGDDPKLSDVLEEAGYLIGTAYQLADDLLDVIGSESEAGKTLGTDSVRSKTTLPQGCQDGLNITRKHVDALCGSALELLNDYPSQRQALTDYLARDLQPVLNKHSNLLLELPV